MDTKAWPKITLRVSGIPITKIFLDAGLNAYGVDASLKMVEGFRKNFPYVPVACESGRQIVVHCSS